MSFNIYKKKENDKCSKRKKCDTNLDANGCCCDCLWNWNWLGCLLVQYIYNVKSRLKRAVCAYASYFSWLLSDYQMTFKKTSVGHCSRSNL